MDNSQYAQDSLGLVDQMKKKRKEMLKWLNNAGMFLFALAAHWSLKQVVEDYIPCEEKLLRRLGYPLAVFMAFWVIKAYTST